MLSLGSTVVAMGLSIGVFIQSEVLKEEISALNKKITDLQQDYNNIGLDLKAVIDFFTDSSEILTDLQSNGQLLQLYINNSIEPNADRLRKNAAQIIKLSPQFSLSLFEA